MTAATVPTGSAVGLSVEELQAAYRAARRGEFAITGRDRPDQGYGPARLPALPAGAVPVAAAHPGAGASTVAAAIADALADAGQTVRLVELADPSRSGLAAASTSELGVDEGGWRRGRRGPQVTVTRPGRGLAELAGPIPAGSSGERLLIDCGWRRPAELAEAAHGGRLVLVCRASVPGLRQAEQTLTAVPHVDGPLLAVLGRARWPGLLTATAGPRLAAARHTGRVVPVPVDRQLEQTGLTGDPLPRGLLAAGQALAAALFDDLPAPPAGRRRPRPHRAGSPSSQEEGQRR